MIRPRIDRKPKFNRISSPFKFLRWEKFEFCKYWDPLPWRWHVTNQRTCDLCWSSQPTNWRWFCSSTKSSRATGGLTSARLWPSQPSRLQGCGCGLARSKLSRPAGLLIGLGLWFLCRLFFFDLIFWSSRVPTWYLSLAWIGWAYEWVC